MAYSDYLQSTHWKNTRETKLKMCSHCQICDCEKNLHIHHKRYSIDKKEADNWNKYHDTPKSQGSILNREENKDLMVLCASCHKLWHSYFASRYLTHKKSTQIRRLIRFGVSKNKAFWVTKENYLYTPVLLKAKELQEANLRGTATR